MKRVKILKNGVYYGHFECEDADVESEKATRKVPAWGKDAFDETLEDGTIVHHDAEYSYVEDDVTAEFSAKAQKIAAKETAVSDSRKAKQALAAAKTAATLEETQAALVKTSRALFNLVKALGITDPTEAE